MIKISEQFQNDVVTRYQQKMAELMEKDAVSVLKSWLPAYGKRVLTSLKGTNFGKLGNDTYKDIANHNLSIVDNPLLEGFNTLTNTMTNTMTKLPIGELSVMAPPLELLERGLRRLDKKLISL